MYHIELSLSPATYPYRDTQEHHTTVAVDILRATTAICAAFKAGASHIVPLDSLEELPHYEALGYMAAAERGGKKVGTAQCGNSPTEYLGMDLHGKRLAYSTTNGTRAILAAKAERTLVGCFSNISALTKKLIEKPQDTVILCSGWKQDCSLEDTLFAGALSRRLISSGLYDTHNDATFMAMELYGLAQDDLYAYCRHASHMQRLLNFGCDHDIRYALQMDTVDLVPYLTNDNILYV